MGLSRLNSDYYEKELILTEYLISSLTNVK